uniref:Uncharacterized protein n=1 Tax=Arundo donax TaxID=35708 RepID=A0A0A9F0R7_ARUDO
MIFHWSFKHGSTVTKSVIRRVSRASSDMILGGSGLLIRVEVYSEVQLPNPKVAHLPLPCLDCDRDAALGVPVRRCTGSAVAVMHS